MVKARLSVVERVEQALIVPENRQGTWDASVHVGKRPENIGYPGRRVGKLKEDLLIACVQWSLTNNGPCTGIGGKVGIK